MYLVSLGGCNDCHSPKRMGPQGPEVITELMLSGYPGDRPVEKPGMTMIKKGWNLLNSDFTMAAGMWGISFSANLTSDQTGTGNWTEENFKRALKEGKFKGLPGSRTLLPPMPWTNFASITDEDVKAIFTYLQSTKPVKNVVPAPIGMENL
jgi:mono/diheme cytochrome c family protein